MNNVKRRRIIINNIALILSFTCAIIGILLLLWILIVVFLKGFNSINIHVFTNNVAPSYVENGGLKNAIVGQFLIVLIASVIGVIFGVLSGTFLNEFAKKTKIANFISTVSDIIMSSPSIVIGVFVYAILVHPFGHFSGWAGVCALSIIMIPIVLRTTNDALFLVSDMQREAAVALGAPKYKVITGVIYKNAKHSILTGILLAIARISGESAPLLFTSFNNSFFTTNLNEPMSSLTVTMFSYATSPYETWISLGWAAALVLSMFILLINVVGKLLLHKTQRR